MSVFDWLDKLGINTTRMRWKAYRAQQKAEGFRGTSRSVKEQVTYQNKICSACKALVDRHDKVCPMCGHRLGSWQGQVVRRSAGLVVPGGTFVTATLLAVNLLMVMLVAALYGWQELFTPTMNTLFQVGAMVPIMVENGQLWRVITYGFLHSGLWHILFNMMALSRLGSFLEDEIGSARFFSLYTISLIIGALCNNLLFPGSSMSIVGASGAVFGLIGFGVSYGHFTRSSRGQAMRQLFMHWLVYGLLFGFLVPGISNTTHVGGCVAGVLTGFFVVRSNGIAGERLWHALASLSVLMVVGGLIWGAAVYLLQ